MAKDRMNERFQTLKETPLWWNNKSSDLRAAAGALWIGMDESKNDEYVKALGLWKGFNLRVCFPVYCMLWGLSFELLLKSVITSKRGAEKIPQIHDLCGLADSAGVKLNGKERAVLKLLTKYTMWAGKYPVPKEIEEFEQFGKVSDEATLEKVLSYKLRAFQYNDVLDWKSLNEFWESVDERYFKLLNK